MKKISLILLVLFFGMTALFAGCTRRQATATNKSGEKEIAVAQLETLMKQATCRIYVNHKFAGTGCLIRPNMVITAAHLFGGSTFPKDFGQANGERITEVLFHASDKSFDDKKKYEAKKIPATPVIINQDIDLAIFSIPATDRTPIKLAKTARKGEKIMAPSFKHGKDIIFPLAEIVDDKDNVLIYNASAGGGSSGAPVINLQGEIVGLCKGAGDGGLKLMVANYKTIAAWLGEMEKRAKEILQ